MRGWGVEQLWGMGRSDDDLTRIFRERNQGSGHLGFSRPMQGGLRFVDHSDDRAEGSR